MVVPEGAGEIEHQHRPVTWGTIGAHPHMIREWFVSARVGHFRYMLVLYRFTESGRWGIRRAAWMTQGVPPAWEARLANWWRSYRG